MTKIITNFFKDLFSGLENLIDGTLLQLAESPFRIEDTMGQYGLNQFTQIFKMFVAIGISLIVVKFLKKGFDMYILWTDGDADADPVQLVINFFKAIVTALTFSILYSYFAEIMVDIIGDVLTGIGLHQNIGIDENFISQTIQNIGISISSLVGLLIFYVMLIVLNIKAIGYGLEILVLRIGAPLACSGLMDADKGVFKSYIQKFLQVSVTVLVHVAMLKLALSLILAGQLIWAIASLYFALKTPSFIKEFLITSSGGGIMNNAYQGARLTQMARSFVK